MTSTSALVWDKKTLFVRYIEGGYIPTQDKQYLFAVLQLPEAATIDRTDVVLRRIGDIALATPGG